jgi:hypothetical protein
MAQPVINEGEVERGRRRVLGWAQGGCGAGHTIGGSTFRRAGSQGGRGELPGRGGVAKKNVGLVRSTSYLGESASTWGCKNGTSLDIASRTSGRPPTGYHHTGTARSPAPGILGLPRPCRPCLAASPPRELAGARRTPWLPPASTFGQGRPPSRSFLLGSRIQDSPTRPSWTSLTVTALSAATFAAATVTASATATATLPNAITGVPFAAASLAVVVAVLAVLVPTAVATATVAAASVAVLAATLAAPALAVVSLASSFAPPPSPPLPSPPAALATATPRRRIRRPLSPLHRHHPRSTLSTAAVAPHLHRCRRPLSAPVVACDAPHKPRRAEGGAHAPPSGPFYPPVHTFYNNKKNILYISSVYFTRPRSVASPSVTFRSVPVPVQ